MRQHRLDIDGLRAVAVLSVVAYHCSHALLPGGYTGVDIFFVISGYLITGIVAGGLRDGTFSIAEFYVRRARRILPALFVVLAATFAAGLVLLTPSGLSLLGESIAATAVFISNITFWLDTGYFDALAEYKPLLHTWSLGVEEQFYLLWPVALMFCARRRHALRALVLTLLAGSFVASCLAVWWHQPTAFYLLPTRAWELLLGGVLALGLVPPLETPRARNFAGLAGLASIVAGFVLLGPTSPFPGAAALLPCAGAALVIHAGERGDHWVARLLSLRPVVFVGLISYSLYLWHWPLLSFGRISEGNSLSLGQSVVLVTLAGILATLTWRFVERPFRARGSLQLHFPILARYAVASVVVLAIGVYLQKSNGLVEYASPQIQRTELARDAYNPLSGKCLLRAPVDDDLTEPDCVLGEERFKQRIVIWGDSHADSAMPGIADEAAKLGYATEQLTMAACPPLIGVRVEGPEYDSAMCAEFNARVMEYLARTPQVRAVILAARWPVYTENSRFGEDPGPITYLVDDRDHEWSTAVSRRVFARALDDTVHALRRANKDVVLLGSIPALGINLPECIARRYMPFSDEPRCDVPVRVVDARTRFVDAQIRRIDAEEPRVCSYMPRDLLCKGGTCRGEMGGTILYANDDHLNIYGARYLARQMDLRACIVSSPAKLLSTTSH